MWKDELIGCKKRLSNGSGGGMVRVCELLALGTKEREATHGQNMFVGLEQFLHSSSTQLHVRLQCLPERRKPNEFKEERAKSNVDICAFFLEGGNDTCTVRRSDMAPP